MSALKPRVLPDSRSIVLKVCKSRSFPEPVSNDSRYSIVGGPTSSKPWVAKRSSSCLRKYSTRFASFGKTSSIYSGKIHLGSIRVHNSRNVSRVSREQRAQKQSPRLDYKGLHLVGGREPQNTETEIIPLNTEKVNKTQSNRDFSTDARIRF